MTNMSSLFTPSVLITAYIFGVLLVGRFAVTRGRTWWHWCLVGAVFTPMVALVWLWFLPDLEYERERTREFLAAAKRRRHRHEPLDPFSRARERQEQEVHAKAITTRRLRQKPLVPQVTERRRLRALDNRTPATVIMGA